MSLLLLILTIHQLPSMLDIFSLATDCLFQPWYTSKYIKPLYVDRFRNVNFICRVAPCTLVWPQKYDSKQGCKCGEEEKGNHTNYKHFKRNRNEMRVGKKAGGKMAVIKCSSVSCSAGGLSRAYMASRSKATTCLLASLSTHSLINIPVIGK